MPDEQPKRESHPLMADVVRLFWSSLEASGSLFRWILASLITLNGGALVLLLSGNQLQLTAGAATAALLFFAGCVLAVFGAMIFAVAIFRIGFGMPAAKARAAETNSDELPEPLEQALSSAIKGAIFCVLSLLAFTAGGTCLAFSIASAMQKPPSAEQRVDQVRHTNEQQQQGSLRP